MTMQPHQQRVVTEKAELDDKFGKLLAFLRTPTFAALDEAEKMRLQWQATVMDSYSMVLGLRIAAFPAASD